MTSFLPALILCAAANMALADTPEPVVRVRGTVQSATSTTLTVRDRGGETVVLGLPDKLVVQEVYPIALTDIKPGSFIGTAAMPQPDGSQRAIAVMVFPESARGTGEGSRPFDLQPSSTMTNATVADLVEAPTGRTLRLKYRDGEQTVVVPAGVPVVTFRPGQRALLVPGASVSLSAQLVNGVPMAQRINAGRDGFALPY